METAKALLAWKREGTCGTGQEWSSLVFALHNQCFPLSHWESFLVTAVLLEGVGQTLWILSCITASWRCERIYLSNSTGNVFPTSSSCSVWLMNLCITLKKKKKKKIVVFFFFSAKFPTILISLFFEPFNWQCQMQFVFCSKAKALNWLSQYEPWQSLILLGLKGRLTAE